MTIDPQETITRTQTTLVDLSYSLLRTKTFSVLVGFFVLSVLFDLVVLNLYPLSYGMDGPFYDIQIRSVATTGFPSSGDPPLVYYLFYLFSVPLGSMMGIKVAMALIGSSLVFPAFLVAKSLVPPQQEVRGDVVGLLSAFLMVFNVYYLRMIEDFVQNLFGIVFVLWFVYVFSYWLANPHNSQKTAATGLVGLAAILTHLYAAALVVTLATLGVVFYLLRRWRIEGSVGKRDLVVVAGGLVGGLVVVMLLVLLIPPLAQNFSKVLGFITDFWNDNPANITDDTNTFVVFITAPFVFGFLTLTRNIIESTEVSLVGDCKEKELQRLFMSITVAFLAVIIFLLGSPIFEGSWRMRFILLAFVPISLVSPLALLVVEDVIANVLEKRKHLQLATHSIAALMVLATLVSALTFVPTMGPTITEEQYDELVRINEVVFGEQHLVSNEVFVAAAFGMNYWIQLVFDQEAISPAQFEAEVNQTSEVTYYYLVTITQVAQPFNPPQSQPYSPFFPLGFELLPQGGMEQGSEGQSGPVIKVGTALAFTALVLGIGYQSPNQQPPGQQPPGDQPNLPPQISGGEVVFRGQYFALVQI